MEPSNNIEELLAKHFLEETNSKEEQLIAQWISDHQEEYAMHKQLWEGIESIELPVDEVKAWETIKAKHAESSVSATAPKGKTRSLFSRLAVAASVALLMGTAGYFMLLKPTVYSTTAEAKQIQLKDGSDVWLNSNTTLKVAKAFNKKARTVSLTGEAFFDVAKDSTKQFIIETPSFDVTVVGTSFNVKATKTSQEVLVESGVVSVKNTKENTPAIQLTKGEFLNLLETSETKTKIEDDNYMSWKTKSLAFTNASLGTVKKALERHYGDDVSIDVFDSDCTLTASFKEQSLEEVLAVITKICSSE